VGRVDVFAYERVLATDDPAVVDRARTPTIRELIVATPLPLFSPSATASRAHAPRSGLARSDYVPRPFAVLPDQPGMGGEHQKAGVGCTSKNASGADVLSASGMRSSCR
jgi:hypothetical protein